MQASTEVDGSGWKLPWVNMEVLEASSEVHICSGSFHESFHCFHGSGGYVEASTEVNGSIGSFHGCSGHFHGSSGSFHRSSGSFHGS